jgi:hypothetical protein
MILRTVSVFVVSFGAALLGGCGFGCPAIVVNALEITVTDAATGAPVCDATVVATEGAFSRVLERSSLSSSCSYRMSEQRAGTYDITATRAGFQAATARGIVVNREICGVETGLATIALAR